MPAFTSWLLPGMGLSLSISGACRSLTKKLLLSLLLANTFTKAETEKFKTKVWLGYLQYGFKVIYFIFQIYNQLKKHQIEAYNFPAHELEDRDMWMRSVVGGEDGERKGISLGDCQCRGADKVT